MNAEPPRVVWTTPRPPVGLPVDWLARLDEVPAGLVEAAWISELELSFRTPAQAGTIATFLGGLLPRPVDHTVGVLELMLNAIEHGNLGLGANEKESLLRTGGWHRELSRRLESAPWRDRWARVQLRRLDGEWQLRVEDQGAGFDAQTLPAAAVTSLRGRGLTLVRATFDALEWQQHGTLAVARVRIA